MTFSVLTARQGTGIGLKKGSLYVKNAERGLNMTGRKHMKLKYLKLYSLVDAAYQCGMSNQPIAIYIAGDSGIGKTWASRSISEYPNVVYYSAAYSPNEYRKHIADRAQGCKLFIHDDLGLSGSYNIREFIPAWNMMIDGKLDYRHYKTSVSKNCNFSVVLISTLGSFYNWRDIMRELGLLDRVLLIKLSLSDETRQNYSLDAQCDAERGLCSGSPEQRNPALRQRHEPLNLLDMNISPRYIKNLLRLSMYLSSQEMEEVIKIVKDDSVEYEV